MFTYVYALGSLNVVYRFREKQWIKSLTDVAAGKEVHPSEYGTYFRMIGWNIADLDKERASEILQEITACREMLKGLSSQSREVESSKRPM